MKRLNYFYTKTITEDLLTKYSNLSPKGPAWSAPTLQGQGLLKLVPYSCVILHVSSKKAVQDKRQLALITLGLQKVTGQRGLLTTARASLASFRLKKGMEFGVKITLKNRHM